MRKFNVLMIIFILSFVNLNAQGVVSSIINKDKPGHDNLIGCGSYDFIKHLDNKKPGYHQLSNSLIESVAKLVENKGVSDIQDNIFLIPVVFHIVYNDSSVNLPDSVIHNQIEILNRSFRRTNADTTNTRAVFQNLVGDSRIMFILADKDTNGYATTGITRTYSDIKYFGGILPYGPGQNQQINTWVNDSLFYNFFRITNDSLGGKSAWNPEKYLNIWVGDLRIFEPQFNNFEELVFFGLATPPVDHHNWPDSVLSVIHSYGEGILMHYINIGSNNPNSFPNPYHVYNGLVTKGKMLVHEVGHYLGLRHIWGDGDCNHDDYIHDTPNSNAASQYNCNHQRNSCVDNINGIDLPDMVENYMDYSSANCQNSFTLGQVFVMKEVLENYRINLAEILTRVYPIEIPKSEILVYPNPTDGLVNLKFEKDQKIKRIRVRDINGRLINEIVPENKETLSFEINGSNGLYFVEILTEKSIKYVKVLKVSQ